ncbi:arginine--tRNA ligase [Oceanispirochaeta sp.]|jgi:arginyl-tRNA synthetase|uniref:arginine--tRNA ligase n=1 Tax=Oceanispirochaeta sp. TaxID=2035350 RepID=UPI002615CB8C|nr:arginine--tRNA ligase [Oceanispirochaeta sp.]MDA3955322.1 arginine--tRNA ligase [Oceanispirochaeta sp.]
MEKQKKLWQNIMAEALGNAALEKGLDQTDFSGRVIVELPPRPEMGDLAFPMFPFAKEFRMAPPAIAASVVAALKENAPGRATTAGPYVNVFLDRTEFLSGLISEVRADADTYGHSSFLSGQKIMVEFSCPNTNKPLHLGHLRNDAIGESVSRILAATGAEVQKVNLINNRGVHICKSMLAYQKFGKGVTPESSGKKGDHLVGEFYVKFNQWSKEDETAETQAQEMLIKWEEGDKEVIALWEQMNKWTIEGIAETYKNTNISFDRYYYESDTYLSGRDEVLKGLESGILHKDEDGSIRLDMSDVGLDTKVLLRSDGTSVYMTQDLGTAIARHKDFPFDRLIYVVGAEQEYHFQVLFHALKKLGYSWASMLYHLSYGMVNLPEGKMKSREGTVVDADDLLKQLSDMASDEIRNKDRADSVGDVDETGRKIALAALHYFLLQVSPLKDMIFDPKESLSFNGNTGPYLQYVSARISSMVDKYEKMKAGYEGIKEDFSLLSSDAEWELAKSVSSFPIALHNAAADLNPSDLACHLYDIAKSFSRFYHDCPILGVEDKSLTVSRMALARAVLQVLKNGFDLVNIPFLSKM